ncbi:uncharacterized protein B0H18DRAFT_1211360 [Fomitopsis serialis]|uniref:uncharacterized protein n=1 Tax=Fomitopsis serialis TaxID=139415 RepID=UPI00200740B3|nr:uncharacterized protein B0H18DRAFT_1211360 [Neoantrodia serialis]KAH9925809.1 hypothetical protein B0H18DRAFT_1211360 [Neoantrodia serialis]
MFWDVVAISTMLMWACVSTLRVYAISNRGVLLAATTAALAAIPIAVNIFSYIKTKSFLESFDASRMCNENYTFSTQTTNELSDSALTPNDSLAETAAWSIDDRIVILSRASTTASDLMVLIVTWWQLSGTLRSSTQKRNRSALVVLLLRDSTSYFVLLLLINIAQIIAQVMLGQVFNPIQFLILPTTCIVISRLILNLRGLSFAMRSPMHAQRDTSSPPRSTVLSSFHPSLLSTIMFGPNSQSSQGGEMPPVPPESPSRCPESALESGLLDVADSAMDDIVEEEDEEDADAE